MQVELHISRVNRFISGRLWDGMQWPPFVQVAAAGILSKCIANKYRSIVGYAHLTRVKENGCKMRETAVGRILWVVPLYKF